MSDMLINFLKKSNILGTNFRVNLLDIKFKI